MRRTTILQLIIGVLVLTVGVEAEELNESSVRIASSPAVCEYIGSHYSPLRQTALSACPVDSVRAGSCRTDKVLTANGAPCQFCASDEDCEEWGRRFCASVQGAFCGPFAPSCQSTQPACQCVT